MSAATRSKGVVSTLVKRGGGSHTLCVSGVLARGGDQFDPIKHVLPGNVTAYHVAGRKFDAYDLVGKIVLSLQRPIECGFPINLVGASMGGMVVPFVVRSLRDIYGDELPPERLKVVLVDSPSGLDSLVDPLAHKVLKYGPLAWTAGVALSMIKVPVGDDMLPQRDEITVGPYQLADEPGKSTVDEAKTRVINIARQSLSGYSLGQLARMTRWMIATGNGAAFGQAVDYLKDVDTTYLRCTMGNSPIKQPVAVDWYKSKLPDLRVIDVPATHCGFLQNRPEFETAFRHVFG